MLIFRETLRRFFRYHIKQVDRKKNAIERGRAGGESTKQVPKTSFNNTGSRVVATYSENTVNVWHTLA